MKSIQRMFKGKLTGKEVGLLMIKDMAVEYKDILESPEVREGKRAPKGIMELHERGLLVDKLNTSKDIEDYNIYKSLHDYLAKVPTLLNMYEMIASTNFWKLYKMVDDLAKAEAENVRIGWQPKIMTKKQYDELKEQDFNKKMEWAESVESLIFSALRYYIGKYKEGKRTPFNKHFTASKKKTIDNPRIKANFWSKGEGGYYVLPDGRKSKDMTSEEWQEALSEYPRYAGVKKGLENELTGEEILENMVKRAEAEDILEWVEDLTAPEDATKWDVLEYAEGYYYSPETDSQATLWEFKADYPELYEALLSKLTSMKSLSFLQDIEEAEYFNEDLISYKTLYENKILDYPDIVDSFIMDGCGGGIAILEPNTAVLKQVDERGYYKEPIPYWREHYMAEPFLENFKEWVISMLEDFKTNLKECFVIEALVDLISEYINMPEVNYMTAGETSVEDAVMFNRVIESIHIHRYGILPNERPIEELEAELEEVLKPIDIKALKPTKEARKKAKEMLDLSFFTYKGNVEDLYRVLRG